MRMLRLAAWFSLVLAVVLWVLFGYFVSRLYAERADYVEAVNAAAEAALRGQSAARVRAAVHDTEEERAALDNLTRVSIVRAVDMLETAGREAGAREVTIGGATPASDSKAPKDLTTVTIVVNMQGSFASLLRAESLYETLTIPSALDQFEMEKTESGWRASARVTVTLQPETL